MSVCGEFDPNTSTWTHCEMCLEILEALEKGETRILHCSYLIYGRFVVVRLNIYGILTLCEVGVFGIPSDKMPDGRCKFIALTINQCFDKFS